MEFEIYNNLLNNKVDIPNDLIKEIHKVVCNSILSDKDIYTKEEKKKMIKAREINSFENMLNKMWIICAFKNDKLLGFCGINKTGSMYEYKILQVLPESRGLGLAKSLTNIRDEEAKKMNLKEVWLTSLCFPKTIEFHFKRGFQMAGNQQGLNFSVRMKKKLIKDLPIDLELVKIYQNINWKNNDVRKICAKN
jgi:N-acetylglutamate synthase-like GNAT family acetyltransferase